MPSVQLAPHFSDVTMFEDAICQTNLAGLLLRALQQRVQAAQFMTAHGRLRSTRTWSVSITI